MPCKYDKENKHENFRFQKYKCLKYGFSSGLRCTKLNQPNCYKEED